MNKLKENITEKIILKELSDELIKNVFNVDTKIIINPVSGMPLMVYA